MPLPTPPTTPPKGSPMLSPARVGVTAASPSDPRTSKRPLSDGEMAHFLAGRGNGMGDKYLHHNVFAPPGHLTLDRVRGAWALVLLRYPLLLAKVDMRGHDDVNFVYTPPGSVEVALAAADARLSYQIGGELVDNFVNGPKSLSRDKAAHLTVRVGSTRTAFMYGDVWHSRNPPGEVMLAAASYILQPLHGLLDEIYQLLVDPGLVDKLNAAVAAPVPLAPSAEDQLRISRLQAAVGKVAQRRADRRSGGQTFPQLKGRPPYIVPPTMVLTDDETARALRWCKLHDLTLAHALVALCGIAWSTQSPGLDQATLIRTDDDTVSLPSFLPPIPAAALVLHRAKQVARQPPPLSARYPATTSDRAARARHLARQEESTQRDVGNPGLGLGIVIPNRPAPAPLHSGPREARLPPEPKGKCLLGVSVQDLGVAYHQDRYGSLRVAAVVSGARREDVQLTAYTLSGKLSLTLEFDQNAFKQGVVETFWRDLVSLMREVLLE